MKKNHISRRKFIGHSCAALGYTSLFSSLINVKAIASAAMDNSLLSNGSSDYKALVFLMLSGGNDSFNMLIPRGTTEYSEYALTRSNLAIPQNEILAINPNTSTGKLFGLHPNFGDMQQMFESGKLAFLSNVGNLVEPTTKQDYLDGTVQTPLGLFSHADQQQQWHTGKPHERTNKGWGGKIAELVNDMNSNPNISMNISLRGNNIFQSGESIIPFTINENGSSGILNFYDEDPDPLIELRNIALNSMMEKDYQDVFKNTYVQTIKTSNEANHEFQTAIDSIPEFATPLPEHNYLASQLRMVAKTIAARDILGFSRQTFFIEQEGWDNHDELLINHGNLMQTVNDALNYFNLVMEEINTTNEVTTFSISDFGRTLTSNGNGTDHAWGGNAFIMGGAVNGKDMYGSFPTLALNSDLDLYNGVLIPTTPADMYLAELAQWFGVSNTDLDIIFPNLSNFYDTGSGIPPIGFMNI